jgi:hypothetical protein
VPTSPGRGVGRGCHDPDAAHYRRKRVQEPDLTSGMGGCLHVRYTGYPMILMKREA